MTTDVSVSQAKGMLGALVNRAHLQREPVYLSRRGRRVVAIVDAAELERLLRLAEDAEDAADAIAAREELERTGGEPIPWDEVKAELGLS